jgi:cytochrome bd-type quinol oxidase subunit 1
LKLQHIILLIAAGLVVVVIAGAGTAFLVTHLVSGEYKQPASSNIVEPAPRDVAEVDIAEAQALADAQKPLVETPYRQIGGISSRLLVWVPAQLHLLFAAFVLAVPMFVLIIEAIGYFSGDSRYDRLAYDFAKLMSVSFSLTATFGAFLTFMLVILYPKFMDYMFHVFNLTFLPYVLLFFAEAAFLYTYYYGWGKFHPVVHLGLGVGLNIVGTAIMFIANAWVSFMTSPGGVSEAGALVSLKDAVWNFTWMPINIHRLIANVAFGGSVAAAYAAWQFLGAKNEQERAHYDWAGYMGNIIAVIAFLPLPFAGYWLAAEYYGYNQALGIMMMGGGLRWLFIIQAVLIGMIFLGANFYLWVGMGRVAGSEKKGHPAIKYLLVVIALCFAVWATPRSIISTASEVRAMGGASHPVLGYLGVMSAKNTAVNILILATFISFVLYLRSGRVPTVRWAKMADRLQVLILGGAASYVMFLGIRGYFVEASVRIGFSLYMVVTVLAAMLLSAVINISVLQGAMLKSAPRWGSMPAYSQYVLIFIAVSFTWLMALMGFVRSALRQHWHVYGIMRDTSVDAFTPTLGYATKVVSFIVLAFFVLIGFVFWLASLSGKKAWDPGATETP